MTQVKLYDAIVFIGRFQPLHNAHLKIIEHALTIAHKVIMVVGSCDKPRTSKNPFTFLERKAMILQSISNSFDRGRVVVESNIDTIYNDHMWIQRVQTIVDFNTDWSGTVGIIGFKKDGDSSTKYLDMFPQWEFVPSMSYQPSIDATQIRELYFSGKHNLDFIKSVVPGAVYEFLVAFKQSIHYKAIQEEVEFIERYKKPFKSLPYPVSFNTVDAVVFQSGNVLLVKRRASPGKGLWALPGGFLDVENDDSLKSAAIRELKEETGLKIPVPVLLGSIKGEKVFDAKDRSLRGRTITQAFNFVLTDDGKLPKVKGQDDAEKAKWIPFSQLKSEELFEDHYEIIQYFLGKQ